MSLSSSLTCPQLAGSGSATRYWIVATVPCLRKPGTSAPAKAEKNPLAIPSMMLCSEGRPKNASGATVAPLPAAGAAGGRPSPRARAPTVTAGSIHTVARRIVMALRHDPADRREDRKADDRLDRDIVSPRMSGHEHDRHDRDHETHRRAAQPNEAVLQLGNEVLHAADRRSVKCTGRVQRVRVRVGEHHDESHSNYQPHQCADGEEPAPFACREKGASLSECERHHWPHLLWVDLQAHGENRPPCACCAGGAAGAVAGAGGAGGGAAGACTAIRSGCAAASMTGARSRSRFGASLCLAARRTCGDRSVGRALAALGADTGRRACVVRVRAGRWLGEARPAVGVPACWLSSADASPTRIHTASAAPTALASSECSLSHTRIPPTRVSAAKVRLRG